jgi:hypothetical protein
LFVDGEALTTVAQSPAYPMQLMLSIYEFPPREDDEPPQRYLNMFEVDYVRGHRLTS